MDTNPQALKDVEVERKVLAHLLSGMMDFGSVNLTIDLFSDENHKFVFEAMSSLYRQGKPITQGGVLAEMRTHGKVNDSALDGFLQTAFDTADASFNEYVKILKWCAANRNLSRLLGEALRQKDSNPLDKLHKLQNECAEIEATLYAEQNPNTKSFMEIANTIEEHSMDVKLGDAQTGVPTGFVEFDEALKGLRPGTLNVIAGRPGEGKTAFILNIVRNILESRAVTKPILIFSMEMSTDIMGYRMVSALVNKSITQLESTTEWQGDPEYQNFKGNCAYDIDSDQDLLFVNDHETELGGVLAEINRVAKQEDGLSLIVVDYLQYMHVKGTKENRNEELGEITKALIQKAKDLKCPILLASQMNRAIEKSNRPPVLSDLRDSGSIESDAHSITFIQRDRDGRTTLSIRKSRLGEQKEIYLAFNGASQRFESRVGFGGESDV